MLHRNQLQKWLEQLHKFTALRLENYFSGKVEESKNISFDISLNNKDALGILMHDFELKTADSILLITALVPHIDPVFFDNILQKYLKTPGDFPQFGGVRGKNHRGFLPTGETVLFLLSGDNINLKLENINVILNSKLLLNNIVYFESVPDAEPIFSGKLSIAPEYVDLFLRGQVAAPKFSMEFPAELLHTELNWDDIVLNPYTQKQIDELQTWVKFHAIIMEEWGMKKKLKPGYRALFYGPPGTGKTLAATLLGKYTGKDVYRIDLSMIISKYIGETEKNLSKLFTKAADKDWILFFDEADALFGKRTNVRDAHDKYANQEVSYLLQRIETFNGLVILATNFKSNIDDAFIRRFQSVIHFPIPSAAERISIWEKSKPQNLQWHNDVQLNSIAKKYEITGASIINVIQYCCLLALEKKLNYINEAMLLAGIKREFLKEGKVWQD